MPRRGLAPLLGVLVFALAAASCESIYDDRDGCNPDDPSVPAEFLGLRLRFVYEYHMERGANAFAYNVDCLNVLVFDDQGNYLTQYDEVFPLPADDSYRMTLPLGAGTYSLVVYGGLACDHARFDFAPDFRAKPEALQSDIRITLPRNAQGESDVQLHDTDLRTGGLFWGTLNVTLDEEDFKTPYREETVYLMKDTNNIQVILQELDDPYTIDHRDYDFQIVDDNFVLDGENKFIEIGTENYRPGYRPYAFENRIMGYVDYNSTNGAYNAEDAEMPVQVACAEFSTSRLFVEHLPTARLVITKRATGETLIELPLIKYLLGIRGFGDTWIKSDQEFLDRQSRWTLMFFLQHGLWVNARITVNWWTVRFNEVDFD